MRLVLVTGCSKGLGLSTCEKLVSEGYKVVGVSRTESSEFLALKSKYTDQVTFYPFDFSDTNGISELVKTIVTEHGRPYGLINNAAVGHDGVLATMHEKDIRSLITVNVESPILLTKYISRYMLLNRNGRIVNVSSIIGSTGFNGLSVYGATKSALSGFTKSLSRELGKVNITVNTVAPGYMETAMTEGLQGDKLESILRRSPMKKLASTYDVASSILFLLSDSASSITGTTLTIDAGSTA